MTQNRTVKHPGVSNDRRRRKKRTRPQNAYTPTPGSLLQRGNYSVLRILATVNSAGPEGITTLALLDKVGSRANRINDIIAALERLRLIERVESESKRGKFPHVYNKITDRGRQILRV